VLLAETVLCYRRSLLSKSPSPNTLSVQVPVFSSLGQSLPNLNLATSPSTSHATAPNPPTSLLLVPPSGSASASSSHHHGGLLSPGHRGVSYPPPSPPRGSLRRGFALTQSRNPPLQKTRHVNSSTVSSGVPAVASPTQGPSPATSFDFDIPVIAGETTRNCASWLIDYWHMLNAVTTVLLQQMIMNGEYVKI
jgi:pleckstrin domain-containing family G protein 5